MLSGLIAAKGHDVCEILGTVLRECGFSDISCVSTATEVRKAFAEKSFDLVIIYAPLTDEYGLDLISELSEIKSSALILITKVESAEEAQKQIADKGVFVISRPINKIMLAQSIRFVMISREEIEKLKLKNSDLILKINDIKLIDRAKCVLIQYLRLTEEQAHRHIQKQAMDQRISQSDVAKDILKAYEN